MLIHYIKIAARNLWKNRGYSFITLSGLAVGMACCFLLWLYVHHERHYDDFHPTGERLYRVDYHADFSGSAFVLGRIPAPIAPLLPDNFQQIEQVARLYPRSISVREAGSDKQFELENAMFADSTVQAVFGLSFLQGNPATALNRPFSLVLTEETAQRLFETTDVLGRQVLLANGGPYAVTGVVRGFPDNAHVHFDCLAPYRNMVDAEPPHAREPLRNVLASNWLASHSYTYVLLKKGADPERVNAAFPDFLKRFGDKNFLEKQAFKLFPVRDIHLHSASVGEPEPLANPVYLRMFQIIGLLVLLIACINFVNLSTATYLGRVREVGVRKVMGAGQGSLIGQFLGETLLLSFLAFLAALVLVQALLPYFGAMMDISLAYKPWSNWPLTLLFVGTFLVAGLLAGSYPAFFASRFRPAEIFSSKGGQAKGGSNWLRKTLIVTQFSVGIALISGTLIVLAQLNYWKNLPLGFDHAQVISVPLSSANINSLFAPGDSTLRARMNAFEERLKQNPEVGEVTLSSGLPGFGAARHPIRTDKISTEDNVFLQALSVDYDFAQTYRLKAIAGRTFGKEYGTDHIEGFLVNELALKILKWNTPEEALGKRLVRGGKEGKVVGVIENFHTAGFQQALEPLVLEVSPGTFTTFSIRLQSSRVPETLQFLEKTWAEFFPEKAFEYEFLDEQLAGNYLEERRLARLGGNFAGVAIFLSCFGLFGLISLSVRQRTKEIGIRKVLGASVAGLVGLLSKDFLKLVLVALLIAAPVAWYLMEQWLTDFAFRISMPWWVFAVAGAAAVLVAFATVGMQGVRAALADPVKSLRSE
ncbi:MAG: ABC transporter permease [Saprospiraceae bacterium]|nr:ABC transporter permease [Saprospiraceae bacterium]